MYIILNVVVKREAWIGGIIEVIKEGLGRFKVEVVGVLVLFVTPCCHD